jgi:hypothetical protein
MSPPAEHSDALPVRLILDASAICAFGQHETVGEIIGEVDSEHEVFAVTTASLAEAIASGAEPSLVEVLLINTACVVVTSTADWQELGRFMDLTRPTPHHLHDTGDSDLTMLALHHEAFILTDSPDRYTSILDSVITIELEKPWPP